jgi:hypothetical protein
MGIHGMIQISTCGEHGRGSSLREAADGFAQTLPQIPLPVSGSLPFAFGF